MDAKQFDAILKKHLDNHSKALDKRFDENVKVIEQRFEENAKVMLAEFRQLRNEISVLDDRIITQGVDTIQKSVDAYAKRTDDYMQEMLALAHKVDRLERWVMKIAKETGVRLVA